MKQTIEEELATRELVIAGVHKKPFERATDVQVISKIARENIHNLQNIVISNPDFRGDCQVTLTTQDSSYDLNSFYQGLIKNGYIII